MNLVEKMTSEKGELILTVNKFKFSYHKLLQNAFKRFKCTKRGCKACLRIYNRENVVWESSNFNHNHDLNEENKLEHQIVSNGLKKKLSKVYVNDLPNCYIHT